MARPRAPFPPTPKDHNDEKRIWWLGRWWTLGSVHDEKAWKAKFSRLCAIWAVDPHAQPLHDGEYLVSEL